MNAREVSLLREVGGTPPRPGARAARGWRRRLQSTTGHIRRLALENTLDVHSGCVNRLAWNASGTRLASVSDDLTLSIVTVDERRQDSVDTAHELNMFGVRFMPLSEDRQVATGAMDGLVTLVDVEKGASTVYSRHRDRVKDIDVDPTDPNLIFSAGEDGVCMQYDVRVPEDQSPQLFVERNGYTSVAVHPTMPNYVLVAAQDPFLRLLDRRQSGDRRAVALYAPPAPPSRSSHGYPAFPTFCTFSRNGRFFLGNYHRGATYVFDFEPSGLPSATAPREFRADQELEEQSDAARAQGNIHFSNQEFSKAIAYYTDAIRLNPRSVPALSNRAQAYLKRNLRNDARYAWVDCEACLALPGGVTEKVLYRRVLALVGENLPQCASAALDHAVELFPAFKDMKSLRQMIQSTRSRAMVDGNLAKAHPNDFFRTLYDTPGKAHLAGIPRSHEFVSRCTGAANEMTDIKEASFIGDNAEYIGAGSDRGDVHIWDTRTGGLVKVLQRADADIVNCVQENPTLPMLATSGIESCVRLWVPGDRKKTTAGRSARFGSATMRSASSSQDDEPNPDASDGDGDDGDDDDDDDDEFDEDALGRLRFLSGAGSSDDDQDLDTQAFIRFIRQRLAANFP